ncbi:MAG: glycosyltransferase family 4 protein [Planctomycetota bacterium]|nr:glycosyltransferase family 4 protein [Planctomycetota bacterium]
MSSLPTPVFHIITMLELGGAQQNTLHTVASLDRAEFAPHLVCGPGGLLDDEARDLGIPLHFIPELVRPIRPLQDWRAARSIAALLKPDAAKGPVVVHTHSSKAGVVGRLAARMANASPVVHSIHGFGHEAIDARWKRRMVLAAERYMGGYTDAFISVSQCSLDEGRQLKLLGQAPQRVIRSGIDLEDFGRADSLREETRHGLGYSAMAPVVGMIACLKPQKAPLDFVEMAALVRESNPSTRFFLAGDGELRVAVERRIQELGLSDCFDLLGWRRDIAGLLGALDVLVLTSRWEGLPRVCPQAMAAGRPVVATRVDGIPEAVVDSRNGFLVEPGDIRGAARRVHQLLKDPELRRTLAQNGREHVQEFDQSHMVAAQEALYRELLRGT